MTRAFFPTRIETDRLVFERFCHDTVDPFEFYAFVSQEAWREQATEHMPWFRLDRLDQVAAFIDRVEQQWADRERARYLLRAKSDDAIVGTAAYQPEWASHRAGSDVVLAPEYWGRGFGSARASVFVELTFETYDLDAYCTTCAVGNEQSRRMLEKVVEKYGGEYEGRGCQFGAPRPDGTVPDQRRFSILREEYETATAATDGLEFQIAW